MTNKIAVEFDVSDEARASAVVKRFQGEIDSLNSATAGSSQRLSQSAQVFERDLIKAGVATGRARTEAEKYQASLKESVTAQAEVARSAEASSARIERSYARATHAAKDYAKAHTDSLKRINDRFTLGKEFDPSGGQAQAIRAITAAQKETIRSTAEVTSKTDLLTGSLNLNSLAFLGGTAAVAVFGKESIAAAARASDANRVLQASAREAGIAHVKAGEQAADFAKLAALSDASANRTYASILQFAKAAGQVERVDEFTKRFLDLAAARGVQAAELGDIARQLQALTDEATDKLLGGNPSLFYEGYAQSIGKTADKLTDMEKRAAILDAVIRRGALFNGEAEKRLGDTAGRIDKLSANFENLKTHVGDFVSGPLNELIGGLNTLFDLAEGRGKGDSGDRLMAAVSGAVSFVAPVQAYIGKRLSESLPGNERLHGASGAEDISPASLLQNRLAQGITAKERKQVDDQLREQDRLLQEGNRKQAEAAEAHKKYVEQVKSARDAARDLLSDIAARTVGRDNPFVALFMQGETAAERMQKRFGVLGQNAVNVFTQLEKRAIAFEVANLRMSTQLTAFDYRQEAKKLRAGAGEQEQQPAGQDLPSDPRERDAFLKTLPLHDPRRKISDFRLRAFVGEQMAGRYIGDPAGLYTASTSAGQGLKDRIAEIDRIAAQNKNVDAASAFRDRNLLETIRSARPEDLTPEIRERGAKAYESEAKRTMEKEERGEALAKMLYGDGDKQKGLIKKIDELITTNGLKVAGELNANITVGDGLTVEQVGQAPKPQPLPGYAPGFRE